jgi:hypothetical protein
MDLISGQDDLAKKSKPAAKSTDAKPTPAKPGKK